MTDYSQRKEDQESNLRRRKDCGAEIITEREFCQPFHDSSLEQYCHDSEDDLDYHIDIWRQAKLIENEYNRENRQVDQSESDLQTFDLSCSLDAGIKSGTKIRNDG